MNKIIKILLSIILIIIFWISGYYGVWKILEIRELYLADKEIRKLLKESPIIFFTDKEIRDYEKEEKLKKEKKEIKRLKETIVSFSEECENKKNSNLWQNKLYWFKMCIPQDYLWYFAYGWMFRGKIYDGTEAIWLYNYNWRDNWWFSSIHINAYKKPYKVKKDNLGEKLFETKTHIIKFSFDKNNIEHIEAIKSLKLYDKNQKIIINKEFYKKWNSYWDLWGSILEDKLN